MEAKQLEKLIRRYEAATTRLIEADRELIRLRDNQYVTWEWVCWYLNVDRQRATRMLADETVHILDGSLERFLKSDIIEFARRYRILVKDRGRDFILRQFPKEIPATNTTSNHRPTASTLLNDDRAKIDKMKQRILENNDRAILRK